MLVQSPPKDLKLSDPRVENQNEEATIIVVEPPTPSSSRSRSEQTLHNGNDSDHADGDGKDSKGNGKGKQVKEGDYLKSKLWWFGLLLIATGEGGKLYTLPRQYTIVYQNRGLTR